MSEQEYQDLWHYSEQFTRDPLERSELVTMAWREGQKLGERCTPGLMKSMMHFRAKELYRRSAFPTPEVGKRTMDAWHHGRVYLRDDLSNFLLPMRITPLDYAIANDFMHALTEGERLFLTDLTAGYPLKEIARRNHFDQSSLRSLRKSVQEKAVAYL